jgi:hypothetical protein
MLVSRILDAYSEYSELTGERIIACEKLIEELAKKVIMNEKLWKS